MVDDQPLKFFVKASLQLLYTLAYKTYMSKKGKEGSGLCLCGKRGTQEHYLSNCQMTIDYMVRRHN